MATRNPRTLVTLPIEAVKQLDDLAKVRKLSRSCLIKQAVDIYLQEHGSFSLRAQGLWSKYPVDINKDND